MKILIKNTLEILNDELSIAERGLLITILLLRDKDPKLTLAKVRAKVKMSQYKGELINLHEKGYVQWNGYKRAKQLIEQEAITPEVRECIIFFNRLCKRNFDFTSMATTKNLRNRLLDHSVDDIKLVISNRYSVWKEDATMSQHLNPTTLFRPSKFPKYLEEAQRTREGASFVNAEKIDMKQGDEITIDTSSSLIDKDVYNIKTYTIRGGKKINPVKQKLYGVHVKKLLRIEKKKLDRGDQAEFCYIYNQ